MGFHNIEKESFWYNLLYHYVKFWHNKVFYKKVVVINKDLIPQHDPAIFTPNHQNALMDALALLFTIPRRLVFMARSDIFKKFAPILYFLKILPIYRIRDGLNSVKNNKKIFDKTMDVLNAELGLVILPEGSHQPLRSLRPLKKGFARIAFQAQLEGNLKSNLQIVPVGIDYDEYNRCRSRLIVHFGKPFAVKEYISEYKRNPAVALNQIKERLSQEIKKLIIHVENTQYYDFINEWSRLIKEKICRRFSNGPCDEKELFFAQQNIVEVMNKVGKTKPETLDHLNTLHHRLKKILTEYKIKLSDFHKDCSPLKILSNILLLMISSPFFLYGWINHLGSYQLPYFLSRKVKDNTFHSSFMYVLTLLMFPVFYTLQTVLVFFVSGNLFIALFYLLSLPLFATAAWKWNILLKKTNTSIRLFHFQKSKYDREADRLYSTIEQKLEEILGKS